jgi:hypothetical protein
MIVISLGKGGKVNTELHTFLFILYTGFKCHIPPPMLWNLQLHCKNRFIAETLLWATLCFSSWNSCYYLLLRHSLTTWHNHIHGKTLPLMNNGHISLPYATMKVRPMQKSHDRVALKPAHVLASTTDDLVCLSPEPAKTEHCNLQGHIWNKSRHSFSVIADLDKTKIISASYDNIEDLAFKYTQFSTNLQWYSYWSGLLWLCPVYFCTLSLYIILGLPSEDLFSTFIFDISEGTLSAMHNHANITIQFTVKYSNYYLVT